MNLGKVSAGEVKAGSMVQNNSDVSVQTNKQLAEHIARFRNDPLGFVMFVFPWGQAGTKLATKTGPEPWQKDLLVALGAHCRMNADLRELGLDYEVWRSAIASGHGVGKSAIVAWLIYWLMSTRPDCRGVVTANTGAQLETRTWPELSKWHDLAINKHWFTWTASSFFFSQYPEEKRKNYMVSAQTVSKDNTEAFQGLHNEGSAVFVMKDEASGIDEKIYEVAEGALTDGEPFSFDFGNPTQPQGPFFDAFSKHANIYTYLRHVDSREVSHTNKNQLQNIIDKYGPESDQAKYRVYGQFPTRSYNGFITPEEVRAAQERKEYGDPDTALIMGIDVARYGDDDTVFLFRRGRDARSIPMLTFNGLDTTQVTEQVAIQVAKYKPDGIIVESIGPGVGVIDQLRARNIRVIEVHPGSRADKYQVFANKRAEWWSRMKDWLDHGCLPMDPELDEQLTTITYFLNKSTNLMQMESKADMKERGLVSPDKADALALTFATKISPKARRVNGTYSGQTSITDYNVLDYGQSPM